VQLAHQRRQRDVHDRRVEVDGEPANSSAKRISGSLRVLTLCLDEAGRLANMV
jgi:hypothetical protein